MYLNSIVHCMGLALSLYMNLLISYAIYLADRNPGLEKIQ